MAAVPQSRADTPPILVSGGLVETRDGTLHGAGELALAQDAYYKANNPAIWSVPGRVAFSASPEPSAIIGGQFAPFDSQGGTVDGTDYIVIRSGGKIRYAPVGATGTFTDLVVNLASATSFDGCHYSNQHILYDGVNRNRVLIPGSAGVPKIRSHGMLQNVLAPTYSNTGVGTGFTLSSGSNISYWVEERVKNADGTIQRQSGNAGASTVLTVAGTGALIKPVISRPAQVNADATHWALFASSTTSTFPTGSQIAEVAIGIASIEDTRTGSNPLLPTGPLYDTVAVILYGIAQTFSKHGPPPLSTSMDVQEDSIVSNNVADKSIVQFSYPNDIDSWPYSNIIRFETKEGNEVQWVRFLGRATIVALTDELWRIDTLPEPTDSGFQVNRVKAQIEGAHGGVGPQTVAVFSFGQGNLLAYVSASGGLMVTDGELWDVLCPDFDFAGRVDVTQLSTSILINNPASFRLEFTYTPIGGATNSATAFFHYHQSHAKVEVQGYSASRRAKCTAPINRDATCKFLVNLSGAKVVFSGTSAGKVYQEWAGTTNPDAAIAFVIRTGDKFPFGVGQQGRADRLWVHHQAAAAGQRANCRIVQRVEGQDDQNEVRDFPITRREHSSIHADVQGEAFQIGVEATNPVRPIGIDFFVVAFDSEGAASAEGEA